MVNKVKKWCTFTEQELKNGKFEDVKKELEAEDEAIKEEKEAIRKNRIKESIKDAKGYWEKVKRDAKNDMELKEFILLRCYNYHITHTDSEISYSKYRSNIFSPENNLYDDSLWDDLPF